MDLNTSMQGTHGSDTDPNACWAVLERAAASTHLNRAFRLREFLFYVGNKSLKDGITQIHEQEIGAEVFGRSGHYDTSQDNIVRVNATELRKRINAYFSDEGANEPVIFQIPRGSYTPVFQRRAEEPLSPIEEELTPAVVLIPLPSEAFTIGFRSHRLFLPIAVAVAVLFAVTAIVLGRENQELRRVLSPWRQQSALNAFWPAFLDSGQETDIVLADTSFALIQDMTGQRFSVSDYLNRKYMVPGADWSVDRKTDFALVLPRVNTGVGDLRAAQRIQRLAPGSEQLKLCFAREYSADSIKQHNVILIGGPKSNPWVRLFSDQLNFTLEYDPSLNMMFAKNHNPRPGEATTYAAPVDQFSLIGYSIVAYLPNPSHTRNALILAGTDSQATDAAGDFMTSQIYVQSFLKRLNTKNIPYFEALLRTTRLSDTSFNTEMVAYRTH